MDCRVVLEAAVPVSNVTSPDAAVGAAISKLAGMLNPEMEYVDIDPRDQRSPRGAQVPPATVAAGEGLVALELGMTVYDVENEEHAVRIARSEIGRRLEGIPLERLSCSVLMTGEEPDEPEPEEAGDDPGDAEDEDQLLPEFEEMVERNRE